MARRTKDGAGAGRVLLGACLALGAACAARGDDCWRFCGGAGDGRLSTAGNWTADGANVSDSPVPVSDAAGTVVQFGADVAGPTTLENDFDALCVKTLQLGAPALVFRGRPFAIGAGGLCDEGAAGATNVFRTPLLAAGRLAPIRVAAGRTLVFEGPLGMAPDATNFCFNLCGPGTKVVNGGIAIDDVQCHENFRINYAPRVSGGTTVFASDVAVPALAVTDGAALVITNGATVRLNKNYNSFFQTCTIEVADARFRSEQGVLLVGQATGSKPVINIRRNGQWWTSCGRNRNANNGFVTYNVHDGGALFWIRGNDRCSENGWCHLHAWSGGRILAGESGTATFDLDYAPAHENTSLAPDHVNALFLHAGGTLRAAVLDKSFGVNDANKTPSYIVADGGALQITRAGAFLTGRPDALVTLVQAGGLVFDVEHAGVSAYAGVLSGNVGAVSPEAGFTAFDAPKADGGIRKTGPGTLEITAKAAFSGPITVEAGALAWPDAAHLPPNDVLLRTGGLLAFGAAAGDVAKVASLTAEKGAVRFVLGADGASQRLVVNGAVDLSGGLGIVPVDADGKPFAAPGAYTLLEGAALTAADAARCAVLDGDPSATYAVAVADGTLTLTVTAAASTPTARADWAGPSSGDVLRTGGADLTGDAPPAQPLLFDGPGAFVYTGADAATLRGPLYLQSASATVKMGAGAGPLTLDAPITWLSSPSTLFLRGGTDRPLVLAGASWMLQNGGNAHQKVRLADGLFSLAPDLRLATGNAADVFRIGGTAEGERVRATIEDGARLDVAGLPVGAAQGLFAAADTVVTQRSARVNVKAGNVSLAPEKNFSRVAYVQEGGSLRVADGWLQFPCGLASFLLRGGVCAAPRASFGEGDGTEEKTFYDRPPATCLRVEGGSFEVGASFNWMGDAANARHNRMELVGGVATLPATRRSVAYDRRKRDAWKGGGNATLLFDGGTLALNGVVGEGASLGDYLFGVDALVVAGGGATVETPAADVAFSQPVEIGLSGAGDFVKRGPGALALTTTNRVLGAVKVEEGLLAAGFDTAPRFRYPDGLLALWDFDGEDPYADRTGHGYALAQRDMPGTGLVTFTDEAAHAGRSARMPGNGALQIVNCQGLNVRRFTVNLWVRPQQVRLGHQAYIASRASTNEVDAINYDFALKMNSGTDRFRPLHEDVYATFTAQKWHMLTCVMDVDAGERRVYFDGAFLDSKDDVIALVRPGYKLTIGMGVNNGEFAGDGTLIDDVAIFGRVLADEEIAALYAATATADGRVAAQPAAVDVAAGATLDLLGCTVSPAVLRGAGTVANGALADVARLEIDPAAPMTVDAFAPAASGTLDCGRAAAHPLPVGARLPVLAASSLQIPAAFDWTVTGTGLHPARARAFLRADAANGLLSVETATAGTLLLLR